MSRMRIAIELEIEGEEAAVMAAVESAFSEGFVQDCIDVYGAEGRVVRVVSGKVVNAFKVDEVAPTVQVATLEACPLRDGWDVYANFLDDEDIEVQRVDDAALFATDNDAKSHILGCGFCLDSLRRRVHGGAIADMLTPTPEP